MVAWHRGVDREMNDLIEAKYLRLRTYSHADSWLEAVDRNNSLNPITRTSTERPSSSNAMQRSTAARSEVGSQMNDALPREQHLTQHQI